MRRTAGLLVTMLALAAPLAAVPLASAASNTPGVTVELVSVERRASVLTVKWSIQNANAERQQIKFGYFGPKARTYLVDEESGTKYFVLTDKEQKSVASQHEYLGSDVYGVSEYVESGGTRRYWAKFPAPPPEVKVLTIFFDETEPFESVPITER